MTTVGFEDKVKHKAEEVGGKAKEAAGKATGDDELAAQGRGDQAKAGLKQAADKAKDAVNNAVEHVKDAMDRK
jgi:uncharacterized protein YjbJ (UPF0337 family)